MSRHILHVIERQCRLWELQQEERRARPAPVDPWPNIIVSREFGSRGEALAKLLGERIGFTVWDGELVNAVSEEAGANEAVLRSLDEHRRRTIEDSIEGALMGGAYMKSEYMRRLLKLFHTIAVHGQSIVVGRGAEYVIPTESALRLRVVCPLPIRIRSYAQRHRLTEKEALEIIVEGEKERAGFLRQSFSRKSLEPSDYDLVVNTGTLPLERLDEVILAAYGAKFGRRPSRIEARRSPAPASPISAIPPSST